MTVPWGASLEEVRAALQGAGGMSGIDLADSVIYGHLWATEETRELLGDEGRTRALGARSWPRCAEVQGELGHHPAPRPPRSSRGWTAPSTSTPSARRRGRPGTRRSG